MGKPNLFLILLISILVLGLYPVMGLAQTCVDCHKGTNPGIVSDWQLSKHGQAGFGCQVCHGSDHSAADNVDKVRIPTPDTCAPCHSENVQQYKAGKHALAWTAMKAMPTMHWQPSILTEGMKGCGGCH